MRGAFAAAALAALLLPALVALAEEMPSTCVDCHAEEEDSDLSAPVEDWRRGLHAAAEVTCDACHGGDPFEEDEELSMDEDEAGYLGAPGWADVSDFCGACHEDILDAYRQSVMGTAIVEGERAAVCTTCHMTDGHAIGAAVPAEILTEDRCGECHDPARAVVLRDLLDDLHTRVADADAGLEALRGKIDISKLASELDEIRARSVVIAHSYDAARIAEYAGVARERLDPLASETRALAEESAFRRRLGAGAVAFFSVACLGAIRLGQNLNRRSST